MLTRDVGAQGAPYIQSLRPCSKTASGFLVCPHSAGCSPFLVACFSALCELVCVFVTRDFGLS